MEARSIEVTNSGEVLMIVSLKGLENKRLISAVMWFNEKKMIM